MSPMCTLPDVSRSSPARQCRRVDLPEPDGPMIALNWPLPNATVIPSSARTMASPFPYSLTASDVRAATGRESVAVVDAPAVVIAAIGCQGRRSPGFGPRLRQRGDIGHGGGSPRPRGEPLLE